MPLIIGFILYLFAILSNSYYFLIEGTWLQTIVDNYLEIFISSRNGLFVGFFYVAIGNYLLFKKDTKIRNNIIFIIIGMLTLILETALIRNNHYIEDHSLFFSLIIVIPNLVLLLTRISNNKSSKIYRNLSICIYVLHRPILGYLAYFTSISSSLVKFIIVLVLSTAIAYILQKINNKYINKIIT